MIQKIIYFILIATITLCIWMFIPKPITPSGYFDEIYKERNKQYNDVSIYTMECDIRAIQWVAIYYNEDKLDYQKCKEWIERRDECIAFHSEYKDKAFKDVSKICVKREEK